MSSDNIGLKDVAAQSTTQNTANQKLISWKSLIDISIKKSRKIRGSNYVQIATVCDGEPRCRTVVFRGFQDLPADHPIAVTCNDDDSSCVMKMITDNRSNKVSEVITTTNDTTKTCEMVWWFPKSSEQYRIRGNLMFVGNGQFDMDKDEALSNARKQQWGNLRDFAREQFFWNQPGANYQGEPEVPAGGRDEDGNLISAPDTFLLMFLLPQRVDYLRLTDNYHQVDELVADTWEIKRVNP